MSDELLLLADCFLRSSMLKFDEQKTRDGPTDQWTGQPTDGRTYAYLIELRFATKNRVQTDRRTNGLTDIAFHRRQGRHATN